MRQVNRDELTYVIFTGIRRWSRTQITRLFNPPRTKMRDQLIIERRLACHAISDRMLQYLHVYDVDTSVVVLKRDQISDRLAAAFDVFPGAIGKLWLSNEKARWDDAHRAAANILTDHLDDLEILAETRLEWEEGGIERTMFPIMLTPPYALRSTWP